MALSNEVPEPNKNNNNNRPNCLFEDLKLAVDISYNLFLHTMLLSCSRLICTSQTVVCSVHVIMLRPCTHFFVSSIICCTWLLKCLYIVLTDVQWTQASLPVWSGLEVRSVSMLVSSAYLASVAGTLPLDQTQTLRKTQTTIKDTSSSSKHWLSISGLSGEDSLPVGNQRMLNSIVVNHTFQTLLEIQTTQYHQARLLAVAAVHSGD